MHIEDYGLMFELMLNPNQNFNKFYSIKSTISLNDFKIKTKKNKFTLTMKQSGQNICKLYQLSDNIVYIIYMPNEISNLYDKAEALALNKTEKLPLFMLKWFTNLPEEWLEEDKDKKRQAICKDYLSDIKWK